jgi:hypothetical protein
METSSGLPIERLPGGWLSGAAPPFRDDLAS